MSEIAEKSYQFELFSYWRSSASWRVRIALALKDIPYEYKTVNLLAAQQKSAEFVEDVNPAALIPALRITHDGEAIDTLTQSFAIIDFLDLYRPSSPALLPSDPFLRAHVMEIALTVGCDIHPVQNLRVLQSYPEADRPTRAKAVIAQGFKAVEALIKKARKDSDAPAQYCVGSSVTLADIFLVPQVYNAVRFGVDMDEFPLIKSIEAHLRELPAFQAAHPDAQPDAPKTA